MNGQPGVMSPMGTPAPTGLTPTQLRHAYAFDQISLPGGVVGDGSGTTIAIVDSNDDPTVASDLHQFDLAFNLPDPPTFTKVNQTGGSVMPAPDPGWAQEIALDVEWAHAIAPKANILLVESNDASDSNLLAAVDYAARQPGVVVVSMSWDGGEDPTETSLDSHFTTPTGHAGVTFVAASGDSGAPPGYPAISPNVLSVGGTTLNLTAQGNYGSESGWDGSGGGISAYESQPAYQKGVVTQSTTRRTNPDIAYDADPNTGVPVYITYANSTSAPWLQFGGTSMGAPQWSALIAIADQGLALQGQGSLDGPTQLLPALYQLPAATNLHAVTTGGSFGSPPYSAGAGYNLVTGRGTPIANVLVSTLIGVPVTPPTTATHFSLAASANATAGSAFSVTVTALDAKNAVVTNYTDTVHFTSSDSSAVLPADYTFTGTDSGTHTFSVTLKKAGSQTVTATDLFLSTLTGSTTVAVTAAAPSQLSVSGFPAVTAGTSATFTVAAQDAYGNPTPSYSGTVHFTSSDAQAVLPADATLTNGTGTFSATLKTAGAQSLTATDTTTTSITGKETGITVSPATPAQEVFGQQPTNATAGNAITPAITVRLLDAYNNLATNDNTDQVTLALGNNPSGASLSGTSTVTVSGGVATFSNVAVSQSGTGFTLVASSGSLTGATSASFNVTAAASRFELTGAFTDIAGMSVNVTVMALDNFNNLIVNYTGTVHFTSSDSSAVLPANYTFTSADNGTHTFAVTLKKAGSQTVTATDAAHSTITGSRTLSVLAASASTLSVTGFPAVTAGSAGTFTVTALDPYGNLSTGYSGTVHFTSSDVQAVLPADATLTNGTATFSATLKTAGAQSLTATDTSTGSVTGTQTNITVTPAAPTQVVFGQQPTKTPAGSPIAPAVTVRLLDPYNNLATNDNTDQVTITIGNNAGGATLGGTTTATVSGGVATFSSLSLDQQGTGYTLVAGFGNFTVTSAAFDIVPPPPPGFGTVIEDFEADPGDYYAFGFNPTAYLSPAAAHDGSYGLDMPPGGNYWIFREDPDVQVEEGDAISVWVQFASTADGRAFFGFGAGPAGTLSIVAAANSNQLMLQANPNYSSLDSVTLGAVNQTYQPDHWYRLQVNWAPTGNITGLLYDSNGTTLLKTVTGSYQFLNVGGIAFRATGSEKFFDTVSVSRGTVPSLAAPGSGSGLGSFIPHEPPVVVDGSPNPSGQGTDNFLVSAIDQVFAQLNGGDDPSLFAKNRKEAGADINWLEGLGEA
jgi:hypothetical protein